MAQATQDKEGTHPPPLRGYGGQAENTEKRNSWTIYEIRDARYELLPQSQLILREIYGLIQPLIDKMWPFSADSLITYIDHRMGDEGVVNKAVRSNRQPVYITVNIQAYWTQVDFGNDGLFF